MHSCRRAATEIAYEEEAYPTSGSTDIVVVAAVGGRRRRRGRMRRQRRTGFQIVRTWRRRRDSLLLPSAFIISRTSTSVLLPGVVVMLFPMGWVVGPGRRRFAPLPSPRSGTMFFGDTTHTIPPVSMSPTSWCRDGTR